MNASLSPVDQDHTLSPFRRILVPIDGSSASLRAGQVAIQMAAVHSLPITLLYVVDEKTIREVVASSGDAMEGVRRRLEEKGWHYLEHVARMAKNQGLTCERLMREGVPQGQIADVVREYDIDLVVIGRKGLQSSRRAFIGSVTERVIEYAPCSVLVIKSGG
jgi:nucleotide-binding universal stress UspA family protein